VAEVIRICEGTGAHEMFVTATRKAAYASAPGMCRIEGEDYVYWTS
jgi:propanol-preferring alcohol dehydrogenase